MNKCDVQKIRIDIEADGQSALSMMLCRDGTIGRQGNGALPPHKTSVIGLTDGTESQHFMAHVDEDVFLRQGIFDHPNKQGMPVKYTIVFLGEEPNFCMFEFRMGLENKDVGELLPYFDSLIKRAAALTESWYLKALAQHDAKQDSR
jgi:hypothetical protein